MLRVHSLVLAAACCIAGLTASGRDPGKLTILQANYPRVFYFRASEAACSEGRYPTYEHWERDFGGLMGIIGKCLEEECLGRELRNPEFFTRFKQMHPNQAVLLHFNGNSRDPLYQRDTFFPGHWIYRDAVMITEDVPATPGQTVIKVADARSFRVDSGRYRAHNDDIALFGMEDGRHDWYHCEQVQLVSVDRTANTITVRRGCYGSEPLAFKAGPARAAAHEVEGPWGQTNHFLWFYNYSTHCPRDRDGKTCSDRLVDDLARWFGAGGVLEAFDGIEFDVLFNVTHGDTDGDGAADNGVIEGRNNYGIGVVEFGKKLRTRMGEDFIIQADGALGRGGERSQRNWEVFNGIESEGWPNLNDWEMDDWSGGLNRHAFWQQNARLPAFSYINHKWVQGIPDKPGHHRSVNVPLSRHRLAFAAGQFVDAMICYSTAPKPPSTTGYTYWERDVDVPPDATLTFHLGMGPLSPERSDGVWFKVYAADMHDGQAAPQKQLFELSTNQFKWLAQSVSLADYANKTVRLKFVADCGPADNATTDHASWGAVKVESGTKVIPLISKALPVIGMCIRNAEETPISPETGARVEHDPELDVGGVTLPAYSVHPPYRKLGVFDKYPVWDEFVCGADNVLGWLGKPEAPAVHMATTTPDLFDGTGRGAALAARISGRVSTRVGDGGVTVSSLFPDAQTLRFTVRDVPANGPDLYVSVTMKASAMKGYPASMARFARVGASGGITDLTADRLDDTGMCLRGESEGPIRRETGARATVGNTAIGGKSLRTVSVHPPWEQGTGYTFWTREVDVPRNAELRFFLGMGEKSPERSDGVWFRVHVATVTDGHADVYRQVFEESTKAHEWLPQSVPLAEFAGRRVRLKFIADAGPADDSTTDHARWGHVRMVTSGAEESQLTHAVETMTWVNERSFTSGFYYRHIKTGKVDLNFAIESSEPVVIESITVHAHPDAMYRVFEKGLVLANPGRRTHTFDLGAITPGRTYRRLKATKFQDGVANNGQSVGATVVLGERDALFLLRTK